MTLAYPPSSRKRSLRNLGAVEAWRRTPDDRGWLWSSACNEAAARREAAECLPGSADRATEFHQRAELGIVFGEPWSEIARREAKGDPEVREERRRLRSPWEQRQPRRSVAKPVGIAPSEIAKPVSGLDLALLKAAQAERRIAAKRRHW